MSAGARMGIRPSRALRFREQPRDPRFVAGAGGAGGGLRKRIGRAAPRRDWGGEGDRDGRQRVSETDRPKIRSGFAPEPG